MIFSTCSQNYGHTQKSGPSVTNKTFMTYNGIKANVQYDFCFLLSLASCNRKHSSDFVAASEKVSESPHENEISIRGYVFYKFCIKDLNPVLKVWGFSSQTSWLKYNSRLWWWRGICVCALNFYFLFPSNPAEKFLFSTPSARAFLYKIPLDSHSRAPNTPPRGRRRFFPAL